MFGTVRVLLFGGTVGKILAIFRELLSAWLFGTGTVASSYRLSQTAVLIPFNGFLSDSLNGGFIPLFASHSVSDKSAAKNLFVGMQTILFGLSIAIALAIAASAADWATLLAPGFNQATRLLATRMIQVMAIGVPAYVMAGLYAASELALGDGRLFAARASFQSAGLIVGTACAWAFSQPLIIAAGFALSYTLFAVWGFGVSRRRGMKVFMAGKDWKTAGKDLKLVGARFRLLMWMPILLQIHYIVERRVASFVDPGAVAALDYARFVIETAVTLLAVPFGMAALSQASRMTETEFLDSAYRSLRMLLIMGVPISAILVSHAALFVSVVFGRGAFGTHSIQVTSSILVGVSAGLWCQLVGYTGIKFLNALGHNGSALLATAVGVVANIAINVGLHASLGVRVLGAAYGVNSLLLACIVLTKLRLWSRLAPELVRLIVLGLTYYCGWLGLSRWSSSLPVALAYSIIFWTSVGLFVGTIRSGLKDMFRTVRHA